MKNLGEIGKRCRQYEHISWLAAHVGLYSESSEKKQLLAEVEYYGKGVYTYPHEAKKAYERVVEHFLNNPFLYETTPPEAVDEERKNWIFGTSIEGYFVEYTEGHKSYVVPCRTLNWLSRERNFILLKTN